MELITELNRDVPGIEYHVTTVERRIPQVVLPISFWRTPEPLRRLCVVTRSAESSSQFRPCGNACPKPTNRRKNPANIHFSFSSFISNPREKNWEFILFYLFNNVFQLHNGNTHKAVISSKAIVLDANVKFEGFQSFLVADCTMSQIEIKCATWSKQFQNFKMKLTYKWNVSLYFGDQVLDLDFVANLRFLSARCGPTKLVSTNGRKIPCWTSHLRSLAATTMYIGAPKVIIFL